MPDNYLITGYWGEPHVTAENDRGINAGIAGAGRFVLPVGKQFKAEYIGNNTIRMYDGKLLDNGAAAGIPAGEYIDFTISNASQGMKRNDLIVFQYSQDASSLVESGTFVVVEGTETNGTAIDPQLTQADLLSGKATFDQMAMWRVSVSGATIAAPVQVFALSTTHATHEAHAKDKNNPHGVTRAQIKAAAEYGTALQNVNATIDKDCNAVFDEMLAGMSDNSHKRFSLYDSTLSGSRFYCTIYRYDANHAFVEAVSYASGGTRVQKTKSSGVWREWEYEWQTCPLEVGVEYRTSERFNGLPVYTMLIEGVGLAQKNAIFMKTMSGNLRLIRSHSSIVCTESKEGGSELYSFSPAIDIKFLVDTSTGKTQTSLSGLYTFADNLDVGYAHLQVWYVYAY